MSVEHQGAQEAGGRALGEGGAPTLVNTSLLPCSRVQVSWITKIENVES
mgnify:CR=1 FL=1